MPNILRKVRKKYLNNPGKYIIYALGELLLIIVGILIAVNINERQANKKDNEFRCQYLQELTFAFDKDIEDVEINLKSLKYVNPHIDSFLIAVHTKELPDLDSIEVRINVLDDYVTFLQQSKSKIEELKYSRINPILNRDLKNRILVYQETKITFLLDQQRRLNELNSKIKDYYLNFGAFKLVKLQEDVYFFNLIKRKHRHNEIMISHYSGLLTELSVMKQLVEEELEKMCD